MTDRISMLVQQTINGKMYARSKHTDYDREDLFMPRQKMESKRLCEYILNQEPVLTEFSKMTGFFNCDDSVVGDIFRRMGHKNFEKISEAFYLKPLNNLSTFEWQHATADYRKVLNKGISGIIDEIEESLKCHTDTEKIEFLEAIKSVAQTLIKWAEKCSHIAERLAETVENTEYRNNLTNLSKALKQVPKNKPRSFYEAVLTIYICFAADPDSLGTLDRYLAPFYEADIQNGILTKEEAKEYLQELFLMVQAATPANSGHFTRGGESHFCIGGYLPNGEDGFGELSKLILEALTELPVWIPQVTFRWTKKTPHEVFRYVLDLERKDPNKRIAFQNDEKRIKCYTEICGFPFEKAVQYTTVGCNEPTFPGSIQGATSEINFAHPLETLFHEESGKIIDIKTFDEFFDVYAQIMHSEFDTAFEYDDRYNIERSRDINYLSGIFFGGCIEKAESATRAPGEAGTAAPSFIGITTVIDSLIIVKQFVFDEQYITMKELVEALKANWKGYEELRAVIIKKGDFFGNDTERSNYVAQKLYKNLYEYLKDKTNIFGYHWLIGDLIGYNEHHVWFGEKMHATPDGRFDGDAVKFGLGQSEGKDRNGLTALLNSVANADPTAIGCGSTVTNLALDEQLIKNDDNFEKTVDMLETYFKNGGVHFQLNYVSREDLVNAKANPDEYKHIRVRVSGFSDYFVRLNEALQDNIIERTTQK